MKYVLHLLEEDVAILLKTDSDYAIRQAIIKYHGYKDKTLRASVVLHGYTYTVLGGRYPNKYNVIRIAI